MDPNDEWITEFDHITVNGAKYWFRCVWAYSKKSNNDDKPAMELVFNIYKDGVGWLDWKDFKGSYLAEKLTDYVKNTLNGQRRVYWDNSAKKKFE